MKFLILLMISVPVFSLEIEDARSHMNRILMDINAPGSTETEKANARHRLMSVFQQFTQEMRGYDEDHLAIISDMLSHLSELLLAPELVHTPETIDQLIATLEGYLVFIQTPSRQRTITALLRTAFRAATPLDTPRQMTELRQLIQRDGQPEIRALFANLRLELQQRIVHGDLERARQDLHDILRQDFNNHENQDLTATPLHDPRRRLERLQSVVITLVIAQNDLTTFPELRPRVQGLIGALMQGADRLGDTERNTLVRFIQERLDRNLWGPVDVQWHRVPQITHRQYAQAASSVRMMR